jgi:hypothetical protein
MRVRRAIERLHPHFSGCFQQHPPAAAESVTRIELTIDETGRARDAHTQGSPGPLNECLTNASRKISAGVPDTGVVKVSWNVRYSR